MTNRLERLALQHRIRVSEQRRTILKILEETKNPPSAQEIYQRALERHQRTSLATVHRTLNVLTDAGLLKRLEYRGQKTRYQKTESKHHEHLIDLRSGRLLEFRSEGIEALLKHFVGQLGYRLLDYRLELFGTPERGSGNPATASNRPPPASNQTGGANPSTIDSPERHPHRRSRQ